jgi:pimeloyl-ACP methyl ester carboxylesterase
MTGAVPSLACLPAFLPPDLATALAGGERWVTRFDGADTVWHTWGDAHRPCVVLLHGGSGSWTHWVRNIAPLRDAGWRVLVPDLPGFGDSDLPAGCVDTDDMPPHLQAGLTQLQTDGPVSLVGFSFGGMTAALWLAAQPQTTLPSVQHLVLVGAPGMGLTVPECIPLKGWRHLPSPEAQAHIHRHNLMALMLQRPDSLDDLALALHTANVTRDRLTRRRLSSTDIVARTLPKLQAKVSAIYGEHDALYRGRLPELQGLMQSLAPHWGQWQTVPGAGHWVPYEAASAFNLALLGILSEPTNPAVALIAVQAQNANARTAW